MQATLTEFHGYIGEHLSRGTTPTVQDRRVGQYQRYIESIKPDHNFAGETSHWGPNAHWVQMRACPEDYLVKVATKKRIDIRAWLSKTYPNVLKEFREVQNNGR